MQKILERKLQENRQYRRTGHKYEDNINMNLKEEGVKMWTVMQGVTNFPKIQQLSPNSIQHKGDIKQLSY